MANDCFIVAMKTKLIHVQNYLQSMPFKKQVIPRILVLFVSAPASGKRPSVRNSNTMANVISVCTAMNQAENKHKTLNSASLYGWST